ncbi:MAG: hypothetical protein ABWZ78_07675 [Burkholderiaceae bacterium]
MATSASKGAAPLPSMIRPRLTTRSACWTIASLLLGPPGQRFAKDVEALSGGRIEIRFYEPGALVPALQCVDAVSKGSVESCWTAPRALESLLGCGGTNLRPHGTA